MECISSRVVLSILSLHYGAYLLCPSWPDRIVSQVSGAAEYLLFVQRNETDTDAAVSNAKGIIQGHIDTSLNDTGRNEAALLAEHIKDVPFVEAWSSSLARAKEASDQARVTLH
jgi:hypothetical protein